MAFDLPSSRRAIAIVGMGGIFAGSDCPDRLWANVLAGRDLTREVPRDRWPVDSGEVLDTRIAEPDRVYTTRGGFVDPVRFDPRGTRLDPDFIEQLDPMFHLTLCAASQAWNDAATGSLDRGRTGVILGNILLPTQAASSVSLDLLGNEFERALGLAAREERRFHPADLHLAGMSAAIVAEAFGLGGVAYALDAACGSSLYALKLASDELIAGRADAMIAGGVSRPDSLYTQMGFCQLRALSPKGRAAPLDAGADGLIVGEGAGMFVLMRLADAVRDGHRIHGVIAGIGLSNDGQGDLMAPDRDGQLRAMRGAYEQAGWDPRDVDLIECHATGTPRGDAVEIASLTALWEHGEGRPGECVIGSVKGNIGHPLTAAGAAGLIKVLMAMRHQTFPPTANIDRPCVGLESGETPFRVLGASEPWPARGPGRPRRAAISGFGFGGVNAHVLVEEWVPSRVNSAVVPVTERPHGSAPSSAGEGCPIAIVGLGIQLGQGRGSDVLGDLVLGEPVSSGGRRLRTLEFEAGEFRIPPRELAAMLPQQSLMLRVAGDAIQGAGWDAGLGPRTAVVIGTGLDLNTTNFYLRWSIADSARRWNDELDLGLSHDELASWAGELREAAGPALSADRTMGSLGGVVASRVARELRIGGPSLSVSCDETSGLQAAAIAVDWLRRGEVDAAIVGAIDLAGDPRAALARQHLGGSPDDGEDAAVCLVLRRLDDAIREDRRILAVIHRVDSTAGAPSSIPGPAGAATGLLEVVRIVACLHDEVRPDGVWPQGVHVPAQLFLRAPGDPPLRLDVVNTNQARRLTRVEVAERPRGARPELQASERLVSVDRLRRSGLFAIEGHSPDSLRERIDELAALARDASGLRVHDLARRWWRLHPGDHRQPIGLAVVADGIDALERLLDAARSAIRAGRTDASRCEGGTVYLPQPGQPRGVAFVYPGLGNFFAGMGRELGLLWPEVVRRQERESRRLHDQLPPEVWWGGGDLPRFADHRTPILGQVAVGSQVTDILRSLGIVPDTAIGYSMGESAALVALRAWSDRDELAGRLLSSRLFATELSGTCEAARRAWGLPADRAADWAAGIVPRAIEDVRTAIEASRLTRVYSLIRNTRDETVIGGERGEVVELVRRIGCPWLELPAVGTVHCEIGRSVKSEYRELHDVATAAPEGIAFYSGVTASRYALDRSTAADAIAAQATRPIDFAGTVEAAYADGVGLFIEAGPGSSCTRLIGRILGERPHTAVSACRPDRDAYGAVLDVLAASVAARRPVDLSTIYGPPDAEAPGTDARPRPVVRVAIGPGEFHVTPLPSRRKAPAKATVPSMLQLNGTHRIEAEDQSAMAQAGDDLPAVVLPGLAGRVAAAEQARIEAHRAYLKLAEDAADLIGRQIAKQLDLIARAGSVSSAQDEEIDSREPVDDDFTVLLDASPVLHDRRQCLELAVGSVAAVFGPEFAEVDRLPTRVRLPDEPLMFVDRITALEGRPRSMAEGRIVTEHDVRPGAWYVEGGRVAPCVAMEAGQADLVLSGYLGVDFLTQGQSVYRLLDATVTFHRRLPVVGDVLRYDIRITKFFRQGTTILFRFEYDATVAGEPLITMRDGCAGFFTAEELASGKGITPARLDSRRAASFAIDRPDDLVPASSSPSRLDEAAVEALRRGELGAVFGAPFDRLRLAEVVGLPGGLMAMLRRVEVLDPSGGPAGLGLIRAEADVRPGDWYMVCHFVDDRVMPGTLMYECCLHSLRILMMRLGWVGSREKAAFEPVPGVANRLKCRGQITESTRRVTYEVAIKERGYRPEPYAIADALIIADGRPIVSVTDLALQLSGTRREELETLWADSRQMQPSVR